MTRPLKLLLIEDNAADAELVLGELRRAGFSPDWHRVETQEEFVAKLDAAVDIILSDFALPGFSGPGVLDVLRDQGLDIPFIIVSGTIGEDTAVAAMKQGATDYLLKDRLTRLGPAVEHALEQRRWRREREQAQAALRESEERFRQLAETIREVFWLTDVTRSQMLYVSPAYESIWGRTCAELYASPRSWFDPVHPDDRARVIEAAATRQIVGAYDEEFRIVRPDGSVRWIRDQAFPVANAAGQVGRVAGVARDITERKQVEDALKLFRNLVDQADVTFQVIDPETGRFLDVNTKGPAQLGFTREEFLSLRVFDIDRTIEPSSWPQHVEGIRAAGSMRGEGCHRRKDGSTFPVEFNARWVRLDRDYIVAAVHDITERKRAEAHVREQAEMLDHSHEAIIVRDIHTGRITFWNQGAERLYGWTAAEALGRDIAGLIFADPKAQEGINEQLLPAGEWRGENRQVTKAGKELIVSGHVTLVRDAEGAPKSALVINIDITEQKSLEAQFLRAQRMESIGTLASGVAHDLNNILAPIMMSAPMLREELPPGLRNDIISVIESSAQRGADIVKQVLTFARGVEGKRLLVQPVHLIKEVAGIAQQTFPKSIIVRTSYSEMAWPIEGDPTQLHQVLLNLCVNARDAMPNGGDLVLGVENFTVDEQYAGMMPDSKPGPYTVLSVSDTGSGIPRELIDKIFDPFFTTKELGKGTGLGLSTVIGIVKSHGGFIAVESEVRQGTKFKVYLPAAGSGAAAGPAASVVAFPRGRGELVLVVDDEQSVAHVTQTMLEKFGYRVIIAADGTDALTIFVQRMNEIKVVLTDLAMPFIDGAALTRALKRLSPQTPVIGSSGGHCGPEKEAELKEVGVKTLLRKPYTAEKLLMVLRRVLDGEAIE